MNELLQQLQPGLRALDVAVKLNCVVFSERIKCATELFQGSAIIYKPDLELLVLTLRNVELLLHVLQFSGPEVQEVLEELSRFPAHLPASSNARRC